MSSKYEPMVFDDLTPVEIPVQIGSDNFVLREAMESAAVAYQNAMFNYTQFGPEGKPSSMRGMAETEPLLVSLCLFKKDGTRVSIDRIKSWPGKVVKQLFEKAQEISDLASRESKEKLQFHEAFFQGASPLNQKDLVDFVNTLPKNSGEDGKDAYKELRLFLKTPVDKLAKNGQDSTQDGSDSLESEEIAAQ